MPGKIGFKPVADDHVDVARGSFVRSLRRTRFRTRAVILLLFGCAAGAAMGHLDCHIGMDAILFGALVAAAWLAILLGLSFLLLPRRARRLFRQQRVLHREYEFAWSDEGILFRSSDSSSRIPWNDYFCWFETRRIFAFGLNEQMFHFLPKRAMDEAAIVDLRRTAEAFGPP